MDWGITLGALGLGASCVGAWYAYKAVRLSGEQLELARQESEQSDWDREHFPWRVEQSLDPRNHIITNHGNTAFHVKVDKGTTGFQVEMIDPITGRTTYEGQTVGYRGALGFRIVGGGGNTRRTIAVTWMPRSPDYGETLAQTLDLVYRD
jgi:hypothetical protein